MFIGVACAASHRSTLQTAHTNSSRPWRFISPTPLLYFVQVLHKGNRPSGARLCDDSKQHLLQCCLILKCGITLGVYSWMVVAGKAPRRKVSQTILGLAPHHPLFVDLHPLPMMLANPSFNHFCFAAWLSVPRSGTHHVQSFKDHILVRKAKTVVASSQHIVTDKYS